MKIQKLLSAILVIASMSLSAQYVVRFVKVSPTDACNGDHVTAFFTLEPSPQINDSVQFKLSCINQEALFPKFLYSYFVNSGTVIADGVPAHFISFDMPTFEYNGPAFIICDGDMLYYNYTTCHTTGMEEYTMTANGATTYYDLYGNIIEKRYNELIIERSGRYSRKVILQQ
jgi:hypothetical protein